MGHGSPAGNTLSVPDAVAVIVGVVVGAGIFKTPSLVAANSPDELTTLMLWLAGGAMSLVGALCYAELTSTYPHAGGDYHYLNRAFGKTTGFLFVWARMTVVQTGSITMWAFLVGDYATEVLPLGGHSSSLYAALVIIALTGINIAGIRPGVLTQKTLIVTILFGLMSAAVIGSILVTPPPHGVHDPHPSAAALGGAMIFVLLTYGGWNEAAYLSAEVREPKRNMARVLLYSIGVVTAVYLVLNAVFLRSLGMAGVAHSEAVAADLMRRAFGEPGAWCASALICMAAVSSMNGVIITSARTTYALGRDFAVLGFLGRWKEESGTPVNALIVLAGVSLALVAFGTGTRSGFVMMVDYTAPVFWFFFLLVGIALIVLRRKEPGIERPFRVPLYPVTPVVFCTFCAYMLHSSISYTGRGALLGIVILAAGIPLLFLEGFRRRGSHGGKGK